MELISDNESLSDNKNRKGNFFSVYMLQCLNPKYKSKVYIGFTTNPKRRLQQHNLGKWAGGAKKTTCKGPWEMVVIIHRFPNKITALAFEWAWQHPDKSKRLRHVEHRRSKETVFAYCCRVLQGLLSVGPWNKFPLEISWFNEKYMHSIIDYVPKHMPWELNSEIFSLNTSFLAKQPKRTDHKKTSDFNNPYKFCMLCMDIIMVKEKITCINDGCNESFHIICLAESFSQNGELLPVEGFCPKCRKQMLWGDLIFNRNDLFQQNFVQNRINFGER